MEEKINGQKSIARHIIDGSITIDSVSDFERMLGLFPDNPALFNAFGDLLFKKNHIKLVPEHMEKQPDSLSIPA